VAQFGGMVDGLLKAHIAGACFELIVTDFYADAAT
jgi:hypothetical protein